MHYRNYLENCLHRAHFTLNLSVAVNEREKKYDIKIAA